MQHVQIVHIIRFKNTDFICFDEHVLENSTFFKEPVTFSLEFHAIIFLELPFHAFM